MTCSSPPVRRTAVLLNFLMISSQMSRLSNLSFKSVSPNQVQRKKKQEVLPGETNSATIGRFVTKHLRRANFVRKEAAGQFMFVHVLWDIGDVQVRVRFVGEFLELRIEGLPSKARFVAKIVKSTDAILGSLEVVKLDEAKALAEIRFVIDDGLGADNVAKSFTPALEHLISGLWKETTNVDIGLAILVLKASVKWLRWRTWSWNRSWDGRLTLNQQLKGQWSGAGGRRLAKLLHLVLRQELRRRRCTSVSIMSRWRAIQNSDRIAIAAVGIDTREGSCG